MTDGPNLPMYTITQEEPMLTESQDFGGIRED